MSDALDPFVAEFWNEKVTWRESGDRTGKGEQVIRAGGQHYVVGPDDDPRPGFGGHSFTFRLNDGGDLVQTSNPRHQGTVPFEVVLRNGPSHGALLGEAVLVDGTWKVARKTYCTVMSWSGITCPDRDE